MSIVVKSEKKFQIENLNTNVGPGSYPTNSQFEKTKPNIYGFNSTLKRDIEQLPYQTSPGPGEYQSQTKDDKNQTHFFKSQVDRFYVPRNITADIESNFDQKYENKKNQLFKQKLVQAQQTFTPSIPQQIFKDQQFIEILQDKQKQLEFTNSIEDNKRYKVKSQYNVISNKFNQFSNEGKFFTVFQSETSSNLGPGSYSTTQSSQFFKDQQNASFKSTTLRSLQQKKGVIKNQAMIKKLKNEAILLAENEQELFQIAKIQNQNQLFEQNPGPGQYDNFTQKSKKKEQFFGSQVPRFQTQKKNTFTGPQENQQFEKKIQNFNSRDNIFSKEAKFFKSCHQNIPGPGHYQDQNYIKNRIEKIKKSVKIPNEKYDVETDQPGPGYYDKQILQFPQSSQDATQLVFKSQDERFVDYSKHKFDNDVGKYYVDNQFKQQDEIMYKIKNKFEKENIQSDQDVLEYKLFQDEEKQKILHQQNKNKNKIIFSTLNREKRFKKENVTVGPGQYQQKDSLIKITFNNQFVPQ